jgi:hypothetical protein
VYVRGLVPSHAISLKIAVWFFAGKIEKWEMDKSPEPLYFFFPPFFFFPLAALATILTSKL